jgi:general secretion pathway protein J
MTVLGCRRRLASVRGFTLVELVVALSILGVLSLLLVNGLRLATRTWDAVEQRTTLTHQEHLSLDFLQRQIESAQAMRLFRRSDQKEIGFVGERQRLQFVAPLPGHLGAGGMYWFTVELAEGNNGKRLIVAYQLFQREEWDRFGSPNVEEVVLLEGLKDAQFAYLEPEPAEGSARWTSVWEPQERLPRLIRVRVTDRSGVGGPWQEFFMAPKLAAHQPDI